MQFSIKHALTPPEFIKKTENLAKKYINTLRQASQDKKYKTHEAAALAILSDKKILNTVAALIAKKNKLDADHTLVVGIGGSNLGAYAINDALFGRSAAFQNPADSELIFVDTTDPRLLYRAKTHVSDEPRIPLINVISQSGATVETMANFSVLLQALKTRTKKWRDYVVVTTNTGSPLAKWAKKENVALLEAHPETVGRLSVFTPIGLFPLGLAGARLPRLLKGAQAALKNCLNEDAQKNPALLAAATIYYHIKNKSIHDSFFFAPDLEALGKWERQLIAESVGKSGKGITPTVSIGTTDLHSMAQLYFDGPQDKLTTFVEATNYNSYVDNYVDNYVDFIPAKSKNKKISGITSAILAGVKETYKHHKMPFMEIALANLNEEELGEFMQMKIISTMLLAHLLGVDCFNQPAVEEYKQLAREKL